MTKTKIDQRIFKLIQNTVSHNCRSLFVIFGDKSQDQVVFLHHILVKHRHLKGLEKPSTLTCFKKGVEFYNHFQKKRLKHLKKKYAVDRTFHRENLKDHFLLSSDVTFCHYNDTDQILGQTFGMLILQDFEAVTPNILARTVECVEGAGLVVIVLPNAENLTDVFGMQLDAHNRFVTESHPAVDPVFNERFVLSLSDCAGCAVLNHSLVPRMLSFPPSQVGVASTKPGPLPIPKGPMSALFGLCRTADQLTSLQRLHECLLDRELRRVVSVTSARGRGKSALLGMALALALHMGPSDVCLTSPHLDNVQTLFRFVLKGLSALGYKESVEFQVLKREDGLTTSVRLLGVCTKAVRYRNPTEYLTVEDAPLVVIDEAAAIPLPIVEKWMNARTVMMASTVNGYEGTGRSLSLKLVHDLRDICKTKTSSIDLVELELNEAIRYCEGDGVEAWLYRLLCLDCSAVAPCLPGAAPNPADTELYSVDRKVLFGYSAAAELFLQQFTSLFVTSHYKNSPNDLLMAADAPAHRLFCLLPKQEDPAALPHLLCVLQVAFEGGISAECSGQNTSGNLIPWIISQQFQDDVFPTLRGARVVRIATHPHYKRMGYGLRALQLLSESLSCDMNVDSPQSSPRSLLSPLTGERLDYLGVSFGLTEDLYRFWKKAGFVPLYLRQTTSEVTGEHSCIMIRDLRSGQDQLRKYCSDFRKRFYSLLPSVFRGLNGTLAFACLAKETLGPVGELSPCDVRRLRAYCEQRVEYRLILDLLRKLFSASSLPHREACVLLCVGVQFKSVEETAKEMTLEVHQVMASLRRAVIKLCTSLKILEQFPASKRKREIQ